MTEYSLAVLHILGIPKIIATHSQPISPEHLYFLGVLSKMATKNVPVPSQLCLCPRSQHEPKKNVNVYNDSHPKNLNNLRCELTIRSGTIVGDHLDKQLQQRKTEIWTNYMEATDRKIRGHVKKDVEYQKVAQENYALQSFPGLDEIFRKSRFFLVNSQPQVDFDNYNIFNGIEKVKLIGGFQLKQNGRELDEKIAAKIGNRTGIVFVSFGTVMDTNKADFSYVIEAIKVTIQKFPDYLFVCKLSKAHMEGILNVFATDEWLDQQGILANPKTKGFVSHCGMNSVLEGIYNGVPMICMPYFGDQFYNAESLARQNIGLVVDREQDKESVQRDLTEALRKILKPKSSKSNEQIDFDKLKVISDEFKQESRLSKPITDAMKVIEKELNVEQIPILV
ncbi:hypothetical protein niasHS_005082 [Heterodera schachtii]|uniref:UDP-glucuronosyltransferase n=1 Tax=Heterodera schachtii TaxID=97005 RepID=A0ABD2JLR7_HETSC